MRKLFLLSCLMAFFSSVNLYAVCTTSVTGGTISGETWSEANSPHCIEGDILINNLTIEPGVIVQFMGNYVF